MINRRMRELGPRHTSEIDTVDERLWCQVLRQFDDANIYQTWSYEAARIGRQNISHLLLKDKDQIVAAAQSRIVRLPFLDVGIAYIRWGPLWRRRNADTNPETFRLAIRALHNEYACQRGLVLRLYPILFEDDSCFASILKEEGFSWLGNEKPHRTMLIDLKRPLEELRKGLKGSWRGELHRAERDGLQIIEGHDDELFAMFIQIYQEMMSRKKLVIFHDIDEFRLIQTQLPKEFKMKIMLCWSRGTLCAGLISSAIGKTAVGMFGATSTNGMHSRASYLLHWKLIERLNQNGFSIYDLNGVDPLGNPGTYKFKLGLCGKNGRDVHLLGRFDSCVNPLSYWCVKLGDTTRTIYRMMKRNTRSPKSSPIAAER